METERITYRRYRSVSFYMFDMCQYERFFVFVFFFFTEYDAEKDTLDYLKLFKTVVNCIV